MPSKQFFFFSLFKKKTLGDHLTLFMYFFIYDVHLLNGMYKIS